LLYHGGSSRSGFTADLAICTAPRRFSLDSRNLRRYARTLGPSPAGTEAMNRARRFHTSTIACPHPGPCLSGGRSGGEAVRGLWLCADFLPSDDQLRLLAAIQRVEPPARSLPSSSGHLLPSYFIRAIKSRTKFGYR
jgi:hypothetical protein